MPKRTTYQYLTGDKDKETAACRKLHICGCNGVLDLQLRWKLT